MNDELKRIEADERAAPVAWMTHHDEPMLFLVTEEAAAYCDDDEMPIPLFVHPPAQAVDVGAIREVIHAMDCTGSAGSDEYSADHLLDCINDYSASLTRALGNAQAEGFAGFQIVENADVPDGEIWIYDKSKITPPGHPQCP